MPTLNLGLGGKCDYHCIFCSRGVANYFDNIKFDYAGEYRNATRKLYLHPAYPAIDKLSIGRDEPANHPFIQNVIKLAKKKGFKEIELCTSGIRLADRVFLGSLVRSGLTSVVLPIYGITPQVHDMIVGMPGAHDILRHVIGMLTELKIKTRFRTVILKHNLHEIEKLAGRYDCPVTFPYPTDSAVRYKDLCVRLSEIPRSVRRYLDLRIPCVNGQTARKTRFSDVVFIHTTDSQATQAAVNSNIPSFKPGRCRKCRMYDKCEGIFPKYVKLFGADEFRPTNLRAAGINPGP